MQVIVNSKLIQPPARVPEAVKERYLRGYFEAGLSLPAGVVTVRI